MQKYISLIVLGLVVTACGTSPTDPPSPASPPVAPAQPLTTLPARAAIEGVASPSPTVRIAPTPFITAPAASDPALVPILMYHHLADLPANATELDLTWTVSPKNFQAQMDWLAQHNFHTITMAQLNAQLKQRAPLPARPVVISFDDGWEEQYVVAYPELKKHSFVGTFFPYTQPLGYSKISLTWDQITEMAAASMDFQGHTITHPHLTQLSPDTATKEIADAKKTLETKLGKPLVTFAYPFGEYNSVVLELVKRAGFESAVTIDPGFKQRPDKPYQLQRLRMSYHETLDDFAKKLPPITSP